MAIENHQLPNRRERALLGALALNYNIDKLVALHEGAVHDQNLRRFDWPSEITEYSTGKLDFSCCVHSAPA